LENAAGCGAGTRIVAASNHWLMKLSYSLVITPALHGNGRTNIVLHFSITSFFLFGKQKSVLKLKKEWKVFDFSSAIGARDDISAFRSDCPADI